jgi:hypothetical protein
MDQLGLSEIEDLRNELNCREGLLIDFDYGDLLIQLDSNLAKAEPNWPDHANTENEVEEKESDEEESDEETDKKMDSEVFFPPTFFGARTVRFFLTSQLFKLLRSYIGNCSFHRNGAAYPWCPSPCLPRFRIPLLCPSFYL